MESAPKRESRDAGLPPSGVGAATEVLMKFSPFAELGGREVSMIAAQSSLKRVARGYCLMKRGSEDDCVLFLVEGQLHLASEDGTQRVLADGDSAARFAVSYLSPCPYTITADANVTVLYVSRSLLESVQKDSASSSYVVEDIEAGDELRDNLLFHGIYQACINDTLRLPSLPDVAMKVRAAVDDENADATRVARVVEADPPIAVKLIKAANSAFAGMQRPVEKTSAAIVRLGTDTTKHLVMSFALKELFVAESPVLEKRMKKLWRDSSEIAATCFAFAEEHRDFEPETALLTGLLYDIGIIPIISYSANYPEVAAFSDQLERVIEKLRGQIGCMVLRHWGLSEEMVSVPVEANDWLRVPKEAPDYCALVMFARYLAVVDTAMGRHVPPIQEIASFAALGLKSLDQELSEGLANKTRDRLLQTRALLDS